MTVDESVETFDGSVESFDGAGTRAVDNPREPSYDVEENDDKKENNDQF